MIAAAIIVPVGVVLGLVLLLGGGASLGSNLTAAITGGPLNRSAVPNQAWVPWIEKAGSLCPQVPAPLLAAQIDVESGWDANAVSPKGAQGLAQFEPGTWPAYSADDDGTGNVTPFNPADAIMAQGRYDCALASVVAPLAASSGQSVVTLLLAAYNAGLPTVLAFGGVPPFPETEAYAPKIEALEANYTTVLASYTIPGSSAFAAAETAVAQQQIGVPYVWGGGSDTGPTAGGFDCSGLVLYAIFQASRGAVALPHSSELQATMGQEVATGSGAQVLASGLLQPGDIIAFQLGSPGDYDHIGIYIGNGQMIDAPYTGVTVRIDNLNTPYFAGVRWAARRFG